MALILASASPRRSEIMKLAGYAFTVMPTDAEEDIPAGLDASQAAKYLSRRKSDAALKNARAGDTVIAADTIVVIDGEILGKPKNKDEAFCMLKTLSGRTHAVYTGVTVANSEKTETFSEKTDVTFYNLSDDEINAYIGTSEPFDKAGAYGIQGFGCVLVKKIRGDYFNVMGLPIAKLSRVLRNRA